MCYAKLPAVRNRASVLCSIIPRPHPDFISQLPIFLHSCEIKSRSGLRLRLFHPVCILTVHQQDHASSSPTWNFFCACRIKIICTHFNIFPNVNGFPSFSGNDCSCTNLSPKCLGTRLLHNQQLHIKDCEGLVVVIECWQLKSGALRSLPTF